MFISEISNLLLRRKIGNKAGVEVAHQLAQWKCTSEHLTYCECLDLRLYYAVVASKELVFIVEEYMGFIYVST